MPSVKPRRSFSAHRGRVTALAYAEDGDVLVTGATDGFLRFWDTATGGSRGDIDVGAGVSSLAVSPSGTRLVVGARRRGCSVWSYPEGALLAAMPGHRRPVATVDVAPSGVLAVSGSYDGTVRLWEMEGCREVESVVNDRRRTAGAGFTPDGEFLITSGFGGAVGIWTVPGMELLRAVQCHDTAVYPPRFSADGRLMATHGVDPYVRFWWTDEWSFAGEVALSHAGELSLAFGPGTYELCAAAGRSLWQLDAAAMAVTAVSEVSQAPITCLAASPDGQSVCVGTRAGDIVLLS
jgi:WD40 repeat protein